MANQEIKDIIDAGTFEIECLFMDFEQKLKDIGKAQEALAVYYWPGYKVYKIDLTRYMIKNKFNTNTRKLVYECIR